MPPYGLYLAVVGCRQLDSVVVVKEGSTVLERYRPIDLIALVLGRRLEVARKIVDTRAGQSG